MNIEHIENKHIKVTIKSEDEEEHDTVVKGAGLARNTDPPTLPTGKSQAQHNLTGIDITVIASKSEGCACGFDKHFTGIPFE